MAPEQNQTNPTPPQQQFSSYKWPIHSQLLYATAQLFPNRQVYLYQQHANSELPSLLHLNASLLESQGRIYPNKIAHIMKC